MRAMVMSSVVEDLIGSFLELREVADPKVDAPTDVVVRVAGAGVCRSDLHILFGELDAPTPLILGHETSGYVAAVGSEVHSVAVGDPVVCYPFLTDGLSEAERRGIDSAAPNRVTPGVTVDGGHAEFLLTTERALVRLPADTDPMPLAPLGDAGVTAYRAAARAAAVLRPGDVAAVVGVGGLGHLAVQILRALSPSTVIAVDPRPEARSLAEECGAALAVAPGAVRHSIDAPVAVVLDFVGSATSLRSSLEMLAFGGTLVVVGVGGELAVPAVDLVAGEKRVEGIYVGTYSDLVDVTRLTLSGSVVPRIVRYRLDDAETALRDLDEGRVLGRAVLAP